MSSADLYLTDPLFAIEYVRHDPDHRMTNFHYHQSYELYFLEEGAHPMLIQDSIHELASYDVALFKPQVFHKSRRNQSCARTCVYFTDRFLRLNFTERSIRSLLSCFRSGYYFGKPGSLSAGQKTAAAAGTRTGEQSR